MEKLIEKIQKLLALATSPNENEAKAASAKAQELMIKYNLEVSELEVKPEVGVEVFHQADNNIVSFKDKVIASILNDHFNVYIIINVEGKGRFFGNKFMRPKCLKVAGTKENIEIAKYVFDYLSVAFENAWKVYKKETNAPASAKNAFFDGLTSGFKKTLKQNEKVCEEKGLVVVKDPSLKEQFGKTRKATCTARSDANAAMAGFEAGQKMKIAKAVGTTENSNKMLA
jgi:hypothetical protein